MELVFALALWQRPRCLWRLLLFSAGIRVGFGAGFAELCVQVAAANVVLLGLLAVPVGFARLERAAVCFLKGLQDADRVFHKARNVSLEMVVLEADVPLEKCLLLDRKDDRENVPNCGLQGRFNDPPKFVVLEVQLIIHEQKFRASFDRSDGNVHLEDVLDQLGQFASLDSCLKLLCLACCPGTSDESRL